MFSVGVPTYFTKDIDVLEKVQKSAAKLIKHFGKMFYDQRLKSSGLFTLFQHHQHGDLLEIFKIVKSYYDINPTTFFTPATATYTRGHGMRLFKSHSRLFACSILLHKELSTVGTVYQMRLSTVR